MRAAASDGGGGIIDATLRRLPAPTCACSIGAAGLNQDLEPFFDRLIFRPRRTFGRKLFYLGFAEMLAQCGHEPLVAPFLGGLTLTPEFLVLRIDIADEMRCTANFSAQSPEQREMLQRPRDG